MTCYDFCVRDEDDNKIEVKDVFIDNCIGKTKIKIVVKNKKSELFTDDDIYLIMGLLHKELEWGGSYSTMKDCVELLDKLNEENTINE